MKKLNPSKTITAKEGAWYEVTDGRLINTCCGCGLNHRIELMAVPHKRAKGKMEITCAIRFFRAK